MADWRLLPVLPMAAFLLSLKVAYLSAFTAAGGQTVGKMLMHIRVVDKTTEEELDKGTFA